MSESKQFKRSVFFLFLMELRLLPRPLDIRY